MPLISIPEHNLGGYIIPQECNKNVCVDVGANVGSFTLSQVGNFNSIHFYEPFEPCFNIVKDKTKHLPNVIGWKEAVYQEDNLSLSLISHYNLDAGSNALKTSSLNDHWVEEIGLTTTVSLPTILARVGGHIDYLKVDCETSEYYFLIGKDLSQIDYIGLELHWHMGEDRYNTLLDHISITHIIYGDFSWTYDLNKEVLCKLKTL